MNENCTWLLAGFGFLYVTFVIFKDKNYDDLITIRW